MEEKNLKASESHHLSCLAHNEVDILNYKVDSLGFIESLQITINNNLPSSVFFPHLKNLSILGGDLCDIDFLNRHSSLNSLYISDCSLKEIPYLDNLTKLKELDLTRTQIINISNVKHLVNLRILKLRENLIVKPTSLETIQKLENLVLSRNKISSLHFLKQLENHKSLSSISLNGNFIKSLEDLHLLASLQNLRTIDLSSNRVSEINLTQDIPSLKQIYLSKNLIVQIASFKNFSNLEVIDFSYNKISTLKNLSNLPKLNYIALIDNPVKHFFGLKDVKSKFTVEFNNIKSFTADEVNELKNYCQLHNFDLEINPGRSFISTPPQTLCEFKVNDYVCLKLIGDETTLFVGEEEFSQCHTLLLTIPVNQYPSKSNNIILDKIVNEFNNTETAPKIKLDPRAKFWGHCSVRHEAVWLNAET